MTNCTKWTSAGAYSWMCIQWFQPHSARSHLFHRRRHCIRPHTDRCRKRVRHDTSPRSDTARWRSHRHLQYSPSTGAYNRCPNTESRSKAMCKCQGHWIRKHKCLHFTFYTSCTHYNKFILLNQHTNFNFNLSLIFKQVRKAEKLASAEHVGE